MLCYVLAYGRVGLGLRGSQLYAALTSDMKTTVTVENKLE